MVKPTVSDLKRRVVTIVVTSLLLSSLVQRTDASTEDGFHEHHSPDSRTVLQVGVIGAFQAGDFRDRFGMGHGAHISWGRLSRPAGFLATLDYVHHGRTEGYNTWHVERYLNELSLLANVRFNVGSAVNTGLRVWVRIGVGLAFVWTVSSSRGPSGGGYYYNDGQEIVGALGICLEMPLGSSTFCFVEPSVRATDNNVSWYSDKGVRFNPTLALGIGTRL